MTEHQDDRDLPCTAWCKSLTPPADSPCDLGKPCFEKRLTRAEAFCWVAWMLGRESDSLLYKYPRTNEEEVRADDMRQGADAFYDAAVALDPDDGLWRRALEKFEGKVE